MTGPRRLAYVLLPKRLRAIFIQALFVVVALELLLTLFLPLQDPYVDMPSRYNMLIPTWNVRGLEPPFRAVFFSGPLNGVSTTSIPYSINRYGFLYDESEGRRTSATELRIGVVGGSTVECAALAADKAWPHRLQELLSHGDRPVTVLNMGISGTDTRAHVSIVAQLGVKLGLDYLVFLEGANDLFRARPPFEDILLDRVAFGEFPRFQEEKWLLARSQLMRHLRRIYRTVMGMDVIAADKPYFWPALQELRRYPLDPGVRLAFPPAALDDYESNLVSMAALASAHGIEPVFATQPSLWKPVMTAEEENVDWLRGVVERNGKRVKLSSAEMAHDLDVLNQRMLDACRRHGWKCLDLASEVPKSLQYFYDSAHFNEPGADLVALQVAQFLDQDRLQHPSR